MKQLKVDIEPMIRKLEAVLKKGFSQELMAGSYQAVFKGKGMEFVGFREFVPGDDDAMSIDWKASLRSHKLMIKQLQEERNLSVFFLVDISDSMLMSSHEKLKCEYAAELVATMAFAMHSVGDNVGIALFNDKVMHFIPPAQGRYQFYSIVKAISNAEYYGGKFDISNALKFVMNLGFLRRDSVLFVVSDYIGMKEGWQTQIHLAGLKYDLTTIIVRDPVDMRLPDVSGEIHFRGPYSDQEVLINPSETRIQYEQEAKKQIEVLHHELQKTDSNLFILETDKPFIGEVLTFFRMLNRKKK